MEFEHRVEQEPFDFGDKIAWPDGKLRGHAKDLSWDKETAISERKAGEIDRRLGHVAFELWYRAHWEPTHILEPLATASS